MFRFLGRLLPKNATDPIERSHRDSRGNRALRISENRGRFWRFHVQIYDLNDAFAGIDAEFVGELCMGHRSQSIAVADNYFRTRFPSELNCLVTALGGQNLIALALEVPFDQSLDMLFLDAQDDGNAHGTIVGQSLQFWNTHVPRRTLDPLEDLAQPIEHSFDDNHGNPL